MLGETGSSESSPRSRRLRFGAGGIVHRIRREQGILNSIRRGAVLLPLIATVGFGAANWQRVEAEATRAALANAGLVREYALRLVQTQESLLNSAESAWEEMRGHADGTLRAHRFLASVDRRMPDVVRLALVGSGGDFVLNSNQFPARGNVRQREYVVAALSGGVAAVDRLVITPENRDALLFARPARGEPPGVWSVALEIGVIRGFLQSISPDPQGAASLLRADGKVLVRHVPMPDPVTLPAEHPIMLGIARSDRGTYVTTAVSDGVRRIYAYEKVGELPIYAVAGVPAAAVFRQWALQTGALGAVFSLAGLAAFQLTRVVQLTRAAEQDRIRREFDARLLAESEKTVEARETMLKELNHRIKNSLSMVNSLIMLQERRAGGPALKEVSARVVALAKIHDLLHRSADNLNIDLGILVREICSSEAIAPPESAIGIECTAASMSTEAAIATPLALCLIELVTNAQKHAFGPEGGTIRVVLECQADGAVLRVEDDGRGMPQATTRSSGLGIVASFLRQIGARLKIKSSGAGTRMSIAFSPSRPSSR